MHRFHVAHTLVESEEIVFVAEQAAQMARVLRLRPGEAVEIFDGAGATSAVTLTEVGTRRVVGRTGAVRQQPWPFALRPILGLALIRPQRFEWAIEKAVELGVWAVQPLLTARTQHGGAGASTARQARWRAIAVEAPEQCGTAVVPDIRAPVALATALSLPVALRLLSHTAAEPPREGIAQALNATRPPAGSEVAVYIGPEGGFAPEEVAAALAAGSRAVTLGPLTLRSETAALAALAALAPFSLNPLSPAATGGRGS